MAANTYRIGAMVVVGVMFIVLLPYVLPSKGGASSEGSVTSSSSGAVNSPAAAASTAACEETRAGLAKVTEMLNSLAEDQKSLAGTVQSHSKSVEAVGASSDILKEQVNNIPKAVKQQAPAPRANNGEPACRAARTLKSWGCQSCGDETCQYRNYGETPCQDLLEVYHEMAAYPTDINRLIPIIQSYAMRSSSVVEMGSRRGHSTCAIMLSYPTNFTVIDLILTEDVIALGSTYQKCAPKDKKLTLIQSNDLAIDIGPTDMLFIDTLHDGGLLRQELAKHAKMVKRWLLFHDAISFGHRDESGGGAGLHPPIRDFLNSHPEWEEEAYFPFSNGLLVLRRKTPVEQCTWCFQNIAEPEESIPWKARPAPFTT
jgi:hypothetical protein